MEWIKCSDKMPKKDKMVLIYINSDWVESHYRLASKGYGYDSKPVFNTYDDYYLADDVTHWMPLPKAPKKKKP